MFKFKPQGVVLWQGPSAFTGEPIAVVATGLVKRSLNPKTGPMVQVYILPQNLDPHTSTKLGLDSSVCGDCQLRPSAGNVCYVNTIHDGVNGVWAKYRKGHYTHLESKYIPVLFKAEKIRFGAWGDPAAAPFELWHQMAQAAKLHTGYTHAWKYCDPRFKSLLMASCETPEQAEEAHQLGWRTFRIRHPFEPLAQKERICPASPEYQYQTGRIVSCDNCGACHGGGPGRASIAINVHGRRDRRNNYVELRVEGQPLAV